MELDTFQALAVRTRNPALTTPDALLDAASGLAEEAGEVLAVVRKHRYAGHSLDREKLVRELGDALWCIAAVAHSLGATLGEVAQTNVDKLATRHPRGFSPDTSQTRADEGPALSR